MFDLLSLRLPVTIQGKMLSRDIVPGEYQTLWFALSHDLAKLDSLKFPRFVAIEYSPANFHIFCDTAKGAYCFVAYSVQDGEFHLVFAKAKVAPMKPKSLPTLELLAVFLVSNCLLSLRKVSSRIWIGDIVISVDAQVVLSWLLSDDIKTKNQFVKNKLKDIHQMIRKV